MSPSSSFELDYHEAHSVPLINSTTCFTGARRQLKRPRQGAETREGDDDEDSGGDAVATTILATELHVVAVHLERNGACSIEAKPVLALLPESVNDRDSYACVGFDVLEDWQVVALMRRSSFPSGSSEVGAAGTSADPGAPWRGSSMSDMTALWSVATSAEDASLAAAPTSTAASGAAMDGGANTHRRTGSSSALEMNASSSGLSLLPPDQLQQLVAQSAHPQVHLIITNRHDPSIRAATCLDFRPLAPTLCRFVHTSTGTRGLDASVGVWLGSADDCKLRLFVLRGRDDGAGLGAGVAISCLDLVSFDECLSQEALDAFSFRSPVMALDWCCLPSADDRRQCVAVACQDGTIRVVTYSAKVSVDEESASAMDLKDVRETTVIVDGPIVCISLFRMDTCLRCIVGSLCGYACEILTLDANGSRIGAHVESDPQSCSSLGADAITVGWQGPFIVAQDLWDRNLNCEDSVICVSASTLQLHEGQDLQLVAVGTHGGRCRLYGSAAPLRDTCTSNETPARSASSYELLWDCQLPYSVHGVLWLSYATSPAERKEGDFVSNPLLVTTRRSAHVFSLRRGVAYDSSLAIARLNSLMKEVSEGSHDKDASQADREDDDAALTIDSRLE